MNAKSHDGVGPDVVPNLHSGRSRLVRFGSVCLLACILALVVAVSFSWSPTDPGAKGVGQAATGTPRVAPEALVEVAEEEHLPSHLVASAPGHLDSENFTGPATSDAPDQLTAGADRSSTRSPGATETAPTTSTPRTSTTSVPPTTTTAAPPPTTESSPTTTAPPPTTSTAPAEKDPEPDESPVAANDSYAGAAGAVLQLTVLSNDSDPDGDLAAATLTLLSGPAHAQKFSVEADHFRYRSYPAGSGQFMPEDSFVYELCDATGLCDTATVTITISAP